MRRLTLAILLFPLAAFAQEAPGGLDCEKPTCAAGTQLNPQTNACEPVSS